MTRHWLTSWEVVPFNLGAQHGNLGGLCMPPNLCNSLRRAYAETLHAENLFRLRTYVPHECWAVQGCLTPPKSPCMGFICLLFCGMPPTGTIPGGPEGPCAPIGIIPLFIIMFPPPPICAYIKVTRTSFAYVRVLPHPPKLCVGLSRSKHAHHVMQA